MARARKSSRESQFKSLLERRFFELNPVDPKNEIRLLKRPKEGSSQYLKIITEGGWHPLIVCDNVGCYWDGGTVTDRDGKRLVGISEPALRQLTLMLQDGEFGEEVRSAYLDFQRWEVILDALEPPDTELIGRYGCRYLRDVSLISRNPKLSDGPVADNLFHKDSPSEDNLLTTSFGNTDEAVNRTDRGVRIESRPFDPLQTPSVYNVSPVSVTEQTTAQQERAARGHHAILVSLQSHLTLQGWTEIEEIPGAIDLRAVSPSGKRTLFEAKTITAENESDQCRAGLAQLLEYRFFLGKADDQLCLVVDRRPTEARISLLSHLSIAVMITLDGKMTTVA